MTCKCSDQNHIYPRQESNPSCGGDHYARLIPFNKYHHENIYVTVLSVRVQIPLCRRVGRKKENFIKGWMRRRRERRTVVVARDLFYISDEIHNASRLPPTRAVQKGRAAIDPYGRGRFTEFEAQRVRRKGSRVVMRSHCSSAPRRIRVKPLAFSPRPRPRSLLTLGRCLHYCQMPPSSDARATPE